jgi:hypothetical protein
VVDEVGYIPFDPEAANLMFSLVSARYERASMVVASNKPFSAWGEIFGDEVTAVAMIDRLVHHAEILSLKGDSYRLPDKDLGPATTPNRPKSPDRSVATATPKAAEALPRGRSRPPTLYPAPHAGRPTERRSGSPSGLVSAPLSGPRREPHSLPDPRTLKWPSFQTGESGPAFNRP